MGHCGADSVDGFTVIQTRVCLRQLVNQQFTLPLFDFYLIPLRLNNNLLLQNKGKMKVLHFNNVIV